MAFRKLVERILRLAVIAVASVLAITFLAGQIQQRTLRWRAQRLSADMQQIRLYQSTWADAQRLMNRWGAWGRYDGSCTAASCTYTIEMSSSGFNNPLHRGWQTWLLTHDRFNLYQRFGGRGAGFYASFTVHDGTIWRKSNAMGVSVPSRRMRQENEFDRTLYVSAESRQRLHRTIEDSFGFMSDTDESLAQHPYYKVGRPSGCMINCQIVAVYYSTHTPPAEIERLTAYDFSCFTRWNVCAGMEDLLPAAREWHLYDEAESEPPEWKRSSLPEEPCHTPVWALARDARYVLLVEALSTKQVRDQELDREMTEVRVLSSLKESASWPAGSIVSAYPFAGSKYDLPPERADHLLPGKRFIVFPVGNDRRDQQVTKDSPIRLDRCGVQEDTPEVRHELAEGFAQNDTLRP